MKHPASNYALVVAVAALGLSIWLHPRMSIKPMPVRILWVAATTGIAGLIVYSTLWIKHSRD